MALQPTDFHTTRDALRHGPTVPGPIASPAMGISPRSRLSINKIINLIIPTHLGVVKVLTDLLDPAVKDSSFPLALPVNKPTLLLALFVAIQWILAVLPPSS
ncbi:hypothetical protein TNCV_910581 [Trichonephila clavipes]|uniref:Uncharacterized protein n=1 Tax=Trichonephila clavipes TaxID=2585209 RepID=A0A8X6W3H0_TRICX|nr:hypothetical protein TNCV_910581 [Trichonephila clavipes]